MASERIESLIAQMTLEEKVGQLGVFADMVRPFAPDVNPEANVSNADQVLQQIMRRVRAPDKPLETHVRVPAES